MNDIEIRIADESDIGKVMLFIGDVWKQDHILSYDRKLIDWQHLNPVAGNYNFIIAIDKTNDMIIAGLGFIPTYQYDASLLENGDYYGAIWQIDPDSDKASGLGHYLFKRLQKQPFFKTFGALGISDDTKNYMRILNYRIESLKHYFIFNPNLKDYTIISFKKKPESAIPRNNQTCSLRKIENLQTIRFNIKTVYKPVKSIGYLINKYQKHPFYQYLFYGIYNEDDIAAVIIIRQIHYGGSNCLRIVDCLGDLNIPDSLYDNFISLLKEYHSEYIDLYNYGIPSEIITRLGFSIKDEKRLVIPNYFEPFEQTNALLECVFNSSDPDYVFFKGDADQERPNQII